MAIVTIENVHKNYFLNKTAVPALQAINLVVHKGEFLAIAGPSGSGKTTLLNLIGCMDTPTSGKVFIDEVQTDQLSSDQLADIRREKISFIFQNFNLLPVLSAVENVEYPLLWKRLSAKEKRKKAEQALDSVGLLRFAKHKPLELSGGQQQRTAIARAIVTDPLVILADEPTANLDHTMGEEIVNLMKKNNQEKNMTFIFSTHDQKIMDKASRIVRIWDGKLI